MHPFDRRSFLVSRATAAADPGQRKYLLLDDRVVERVWGASLALGTVVKDPHNPLFGEDRPWEARFDNLYANVHYDGARKLFQCWYSPFTIDPAVASTPREQRARVPYKPHDREMGICYAHSRDGVSWEKPELGLVEFQGSKRNNLVLRGPHGAGVWY